MLYGETLCLICEEEARSRQLRPVEISAPALSGYVGGSVSYVLGFDSVVLGDGGVSVPCGDDMELYGVDTVV